jgi:glucose/mannose-6-phosphate isomerase
MKTDEALSQMEAYINRFPSDLHESVKIGRAAIAKFRQRPISNVLIAGLGGSGIGGRIASDLTRSFRTVPIQLVQDYIIPEWVSERTLFIAVSYSGNTEETLSALALARSKGAQIAAITSGGKLMEMSRQDGFDAIQIPGGQPPRTSFGYNATQVFFILTHYGVIDINVPSLFESTATFLERESSSIKVEAALVASSLKGTLPVIYSEGYLEGVALRFKQQINENAKMMCWHQVIPEMNHNELVGWAGGSSNMAAIFLCGERDHLRNIKRRELSKEIISRYTSNVVEIKARGEGSIQQAYYLLHFCDWVSYYLAVESNVDPIEIEVIDYLKKELDEH